MYSIQVKNGLHLHPKLVFFANKGFLDIFCKSSFTIGNYGDIEIASSFSVSGNNLPERGVRLLYVKNQYGTWTIGKHYY
jgi:hypothetical protein